VSVDVYNGAGTFLDSDFTPLNGTYSITGLKPSVSGYIVCFDASSAAGGTSTTGYTSECYNDVPWDGGFTPPGGATLVPVASGAASTGINAALASSGGISGKAIDNATLAPLGSVDVDVYLGSTFVDSASTKANGTYSITALPPSASGYTVCFGAFGVTGGSSFGYQSQCYKNVAWTGGAVPSGTTPVPVVAGAFASGINARLVANGAISGTVTAANGGAPLNKVTVSVLSGSTSKQATTALNGTYTVSGLPPSASGYVVCLEAGVATGGTSTTGYMSECYNDVPWSGGFGPPPGTTKVPVTSGAATPNINATIAAGSAIAGTVTAATGGGLLQHVQVVVFDPANLFTVETVETNANGTYKVKSLVPSATGYVVCFDAVTAVGGASTTGYRDQCFQNVPWSSDSFAPPDAATKVPTTTGATTTGINAALGSAGGINGTITGGGAALQSVFVLVVGEGNDIVAVRRPRRTARTRSRASSRRWRGTRCASNRPSPPVDRRRPATRASATRTSRGAAARRSKWARRACR